MEVSIIIVAVGITVAVIVLAFSKLAVVFKERNHEEIEYRKHMYERGFVEVIADLDGESSQTVWRRPGEQNIPAVQSNCC